MKDIITNHLKGYHARYTFYNLSSDTFVYADHTRMTLWGPAKENIITSFRAHDVYNIIQTARSRYNEDLIQSHILLVPINALGLPVFAEAVTMVELYENLKEKDYE